MTFAVLRVVVVLRVVAVIRVVVVLRVARTRCIQTEGIAHSQIGFRIVPAGTTRAQHFTGRVNGDTGLGAELGIAMGGGINRETILAGLDQDVPGVEVGQVVSNARPA